jgi:nitrile hydratase accessory protein
MTDRQDIESADDTTNSPTIGDVPDASTLLEEGENISFDAPWQARAFAIAVMLSEYYDDKYTWSEFQHELVAAIDTDGKADEPSDTLNESDRESQYYEQWLQALEHIVLENRLVNPDEIDQRVREFADGDRDASEFVTGEHDHTHESGLHQHPHHSHD